MDPSWDMNHSEYEPKQWPFHRGSHPPGATGHHWTHRRLELLQKKTTAATADVEVSNSTQRPRGVRNI